MDTLDLLQERAKILRTELWISRQKLDKKKAAYARIKKLIAEEKKSAKS
jgi:hypothetical protein